MGLNALRHALCAMLFVLHIVDDMIKVIKIIIIITLSFFLSLDCEAQTEHLIRGRTMGTFYQVQVVTDGSDGMADLKEKVEKRLVEVNQSMSTYLPQSEISRFNSFDRTGVKFKISDDFYQVMQVAEKIYRLSDGAWDGTINPLVDLWGFGRKGIKTVIPDKTEIIRLKSSVGFHQIKIVAPEYLVKNRAEKLNKLEI